jgi:hypothetical protein
MIINDYRITMIIKYYRKKNIKQCGQVLNLDLKKIIGLP